MCLKRSSAWVGLLVLALFLTAALTLAAPRLPAAATAPPSALDLIDRALTSVAGPDDEGSYNLIDPIGPGGARSTEAIDEVFASTFVAGRYAPWNYRDPFATPPARPTFENRTYRDMRGPAR